MQQPNPMVPMDALYPFRSLQPSNQVPRTTGTDHVHNSFRLRKLSRLQIVLHTCKAVWLACVMPKEAFGIDRRHTVSLEIGAAVIPVALG